MSEKRYWFKAYWDSWGGPEGSWEEFVRWGVQNLKAFWGGSIKVVSFKATPTELLAVAKRFGANSDSFVVKVGYDYEPLSEVVE